MRLFAFFIYIFAFFTGVLLIDSFSGVGNSAFARDIIMGEDGVPDVSDAERARRSLPEANGIADMLCRGISLAQSDITKIIVAIILVVMGYGAYLGKTGIGLLVSFAIGAVIMFSVVNVFILLSPYTDVKEGCDCKQLILIRVEPNGDRLLMRTNLNKDCTPISKVSN